MTGRMKLKLIVALLGFRHSKPATEGPYAATPRSNCCSVHSDIADSLQTLAWTRLCRHALTAVPPPCLSARLQGTVLAPLGRGVAYSSSRTQKLSLSHHLPHLS